MRTIGKGREPASLVRYRGDPHATWDNYPDKDDARIALCEEQGYVCAFCCRRIEPEDANLQVKVGIPPDRNRGMRCAHWMPQSLDSSLQLVWTNLLAACFGGEGTNDVHCDVAQKDTRLHIHPVLGHPTPEEVFSYGSDGSMIGNTPDAVADIKTLNLDAKDRRLRRGRDGAWRGVYDVLASRRGTVSVTDLIRMRDSARRGKSGRLQPYVNVVLFILDKQVRSHGGTP